MFQGLFWMAASLVFGSAASAQPAEVEWTVTVDPLTTALGYVHVQVERKLSDHASLYLGPHMRLFDGVLTDGHEPYIGLGGEAGFRYFPWGKAPVGGWLMARQVLAGLSTTDPAPKESKIGGYSSVLAGYTGVIGGHFVLSGGAGVNYLYYDIADYGTSGPFLALHTNIGVAF